MMTPDEFVTVSYRAWINQVANWAADRTDPLQLWCETWGASPERKRHETRDAFMFVKRSEKLLLLSG